METMDRITANITAKINDLAEERLVQTNEGTFGAHECFRAVGTGDPAYGNYRIYEAIDGTRRIVGCPPKEAPGYARFFSTPSAKARRAQITQLRLLLTSLLTHPSYAPLPHQAREFNK